MLGNDFVARDTDKVPADKKNADVAAMAATGLAYPGTTGIYGGGFLAERSGPTYC